MRNKHVIVMCCPLLVIVHPDRAKHAQDGSPPQPLSNCFSLLCTKKVFLERLQEKMLTIGLEPITLWEQILSLSCLPVSPSEH